MNEQLTDLRQDMSFFGRTEELYQLVKNLQRGRHTLLVGDKGIGKSRLMLEAKWILTGRTKRIDFSANFMTQITRTTWSSHQSQSIQDSLY